MIGNYYGISDSLVSILEGIAGKVSLGSSLNYRSGALPFHDNINPLNWAPQVAKIADAVIAVVGFLPIWKEKRSMQLLPLTEGIAWSSPYPESSGLCKATCGK
ncbi:hypothetical protein P4S73_00795 [Paraglaciecola sp. Hal342]